MKTVTAKNAILERKLVHELLRAFQINNNLFGSSIRNVHAPTNSRDHNADSPPKHAQYRADEKKGAYAQNKILLVAQESFHGYLKYTFP
jgi:hypothetical protein